MRRKRDTVVYDERDNVYDIDEKPQTINVYSGLYVNEAEDLDDDEINDDLLVDVVSDTLDKRKGHCSIIFLFSGPMTQTHSVSHKGASLSASPLPA